VSVGVEREHRGENSFDVRPKRPRGVKVSQGGQTRR